MTLQLLSATRNSFFFIEETHLEEGHLSQNLKQRSRPDFARLACAHFGSGADGLVIVKRVAGNLDYQFEWDFYNRDGSSAEMCGNAARCMGYFVKHGLGYAAENFRFKSLAGIIGVKVLGSNIYSVQMPEHRIHSLWVEDSGLPAGLRYSLINTGVPHAVIKVSKIIPSQLLPLAKQFRFRHEFGPAGANVSFFSESNKLFEGITFERGVEDFTASCGTGVVAMALAEFYSEKQLRQGPHSLQINTPGGPLQVDLDSSTKFCWLTGPAQADEVVQSYDS